MKLWSMLEKVAFLKRKIPQVCNLRSIIKFRHIQSKLFTLVSVILLTALLTSSLITYFKVKDFLVSDIEQNLSSVAIASSKEISNWVLICKNEIETMANIPMFKEEATLFSNDENKEKVASYLIAENKRNTSFELIYATNVRGLSISSKDGQSFTVNTREDYFKEVINNGKTYISDPTYSKISSALVIIITTPIKKDDKVIGMLCGNLSMGEFLKKVKAINTGKKGFAYLVQGNGLYMCHPDSSLAMAYNPLKDLKADKDLKTAT